MIESLLGVLISLALLIWSCDFAIKNSILISHVYKIRPILVGIFIIAIGTSLPEFAATFQALKLNSVGIVAGNLVGSNIANILLVGGIMLYPITRLVTDKRDKSTFLFFLIFSIVFFIFIIFNFNIGYIYGVLLFGLLCFFIYFELKKPIDETNTISEITHSSSFFIILKIILAFIALFFSSKYFIVYAKDLTSIFGVAETTIGITIVAFGTSLPEVIATILSIVKKQNNLAIGNILGSNIANIFGITIIAVLINGSINFYELLSQIDKWLFLVTSLLFFIIISLKLAGKLISLGFILAYMIYFVFLYL